MSVHLYFEVNSSFLGLCKFFLIGFWLSLEFNDFLFHIDLIVDFDVIDDGLILSGKFVGSGEFLIVDFFIEFLFGLLEDFIERFDFEFVLSFYWIKGFFSRISLKWDLIMISFFYGSDFNLIFFDDILDFGLIVFLDRFIG